MQAALCLVVKENARAPGDLVNPKFSTPLLSLFCFDHEIPPSHVQMHIGVFLQKHIFSTGYFYKMKYMYKPL